MNNREQIEQQLIKTFLQTGKIGRTTPINIQHAKKIAYMASLSIINKQNKHNPAVRKGQSPCSPVGCVQLALFSLI